MRRLTYLLLPALAVLANASGRPALAAQEPPRLVVLVSVDQLATWVFRAGLPHLGEMGLRRIMAQGVSFERCAFTHACTETGPGHATLGTGAPARLHGIIRNEWFDPITKKTVYCADQECDAPAEGSGLTKSRGPANLLAPTLGDSMKACNGPGSKVFSVSFKDRAAILMVGKSADLALWVNKSTGAMTSSPVYGEALPQWVHAFNERKVADRWFGKEWTRFGPASAYAGLVDDRPYEIPHNDGRKQRTLPALLTGGKDAPSSTYYRQLYAAPHGNELILETALAAVEGMQLGQDATPDLLAVSFSCNDVVGHVFGPNSVEARDTLLRVDDQIARLMHALDAKVGAGRYVMMVSADHGVGPCPEFAAAAGVPAGRGPLQTYARRFAEKAIRNVLGDPPDEMDYVAKVRSGAIWFDRELLPPGSEESGVAARAAAEAVVKVRGIHSAYLLSDLLKVGTDTLNPIARAMAEAVDPTRSGEVQLVAEPYWLDGTSPASHGSPWSYDREVPYLAMGPGIVRGKRITASVTPGIGVVLAAQLLGIPAPAMAVDDLPDGVLR